MTKKRKIRYCAGCIDIFGDSEILAKSYIHICEFYCFRGYSYTFNDQEKGNGTGALVKHLEKLRLVTTTDFADNVVAVKPNYHNYSQENGHLFCASVEEHSPSFMDDNDCEC